MDKSLAEEALLKSLGIIERDKLKDIVKNKVLNQLRNKFINLNIDFQIYDKYLVFYVSHLGIIDMNYKITINLFEFKNHLDLTNLFKLEEFLIEYVSFNLISEWESYILKKGD